ncbi:hypothetical protein B0T22DRAFT_489727 [Podospora appendiculata]|uniref:IBR domain-containing protein n=1 Tax=Podospora appendiculata TaxID=314037 RepID=A0AAE1CBZ3_9PEZI|nr:hypothetical protein B0T22DRAFT_489727 [Podospora appendiculata]
MENSLSSVVEGWQSYHAEADLVSTGCDERHSLCKKCLRQCVVTACSIEHLWPPRCCTTGVINAETVRHIDDLAVRIYFRERSQEFSLPSWQRWYCTNTECRAYIPWQDPSETAGPPSIFGGQSWVHCPSCKTKHCTVCKERLDAHDDRGRCQAIELRGISG